MRLIDANELPVRSIDETDLPRDTGLLVVLKEDIDNAPTVEVPENEVNCVLTMFGKCSYNKTGCSDCEIKDKIRKALEERPQGKWLYPYADNIIGKRHIGRSWKVCSICKQSFTNNISWNANFCPNCGAEIKI